MIVLIGEKDNNNSKQQQKKVMWKLIGIQMKGYYIQALQLSAAWDLRAENAPQKKNELRIH